MGEEGETILYKRKILGKVGGGRGNSGKYLEKLGGNNVYFAGKR